MIASNPNAPNATIVGLNGTTGGDIGASDGPSAGVPLLPARLQPSVNASWLDIDTPPGATCEVSWHLLTFSQNSQVQIMACEDVVHLTVEI